MIDEQLFEDLKEVYDKNVQLFKDQNSGVFVEKVNPLTLSAVERAIDVEGQVVDRRYIFEHYRNFTVNPQVTDEQRGYIIKVEISPDISWEAKK